MGSTGAGWRGTGADLQKAGLFKERIDVPHLGQRFDPGDRAEFAGTAHEVSRNSGAAVGGMDDHSLEQHNLAAESPQ